MNIIFSFIRVVVNEKNWYKFILNYSFVIVIDFMYIIKKKILYINLNKMKVRMF